MKQQSVQQKTARVVCYIMIGDRYYATFRGEVPLHAHMGRQGECMWLYDFDDINNAIRSKFPSLKNKQYQLHFCKQLKKVI